MGDHLRHPGVGCSAFGLPVQAEWLADAFAGERLRRILRAEALSHLLWERGGAGTPPSTGGARRPKCYLLWAEPRSLQMFLSPSPLILLQRCVLRRGFRHKPADGRLVSDTVKEKGIELVLTIAWMISLSRTNISEEKTQSARRETLLWVSLENTSPVHDTT
jgi:hypothetical protein